MDNDKPKQGDADFPVDANCSAVNKLILDYYKKFGRKRDIEQFFSLSTAQQDLSEPSSLFWKRMKEQNDSSDSSDKKIGSSTEVCRISIKCSMEDPQTSKIYSKNIDSDTESPPIISDDLPCKCLDSEGDSNKSDGENSHKSIDMTLDTSLNRPHSPTSSITSQRKLEWDSLADVGYGNESVRKNSASSLSTLERLALHQQYSNNDTKQELGVPTAHSTPLDETESKSKIKKEGNKRTSKFCKKDVDIMEVNIPNASDNSNQPINVNLTKHISFNDEKNGVVKVDNMTKNVSVSRDNLTSDVPKDNVDKEIQTTLPSNLKGNDNVAMSVKDHSSRPRFPILINLNTIRNKKKKRRRKLSRPKKRGTVDKENTPQEKSINQESDAESFEYMPGHMYNQNKIENKGSVLNIADNKSSLESSACHTTESSKDLQCTFTKELEKSIQLLKLAVQHRYKDTSLKKKLIKEVVQSLIQTNYKNDGSSNEFIFGSNQNNLTTFSTLESNNLDSKPKKSILAEKFNSGEIATTSQSAPNLPAIATATNHEKLVNLSSTDSDFSYKSKYLSEVFLANSSSEEIYKKYLIALKKESLYKKKLKEQELLLRQKITQTSEQVVQADVKAKSNIDHLIKDLTRNNLADGSGDASNTGPSSSNVENGSGQGSKSHTVFTLSGGPNDFKRIKKLRNRLESEINRSMEAGSNTQCQDCSAYKYEKIVVTDSSVQVNFDNRFITKTDNLDYNNHLLNSEKICYDNSQENIKYVCLCTEKTNDVPDKFLIYRCSKVPSKCIMLGSNIKTNICSDQKSEKVDHPYNTNTYDSRDLITKKNSTTSTQSSQTQFSIPKLIKSSCCKTSYAKYKSPNKKDIEKNMASLSKPSCNTCKGTILTQTEISIDPKISDPSISDIKIIEDELCHDQSNNSDGEKDHKLCKNAEHSRNKIIAIDNSPMEKDYVVSRPENYRKIVENDSELVTLKNIQSQSNFTIPIHGTNMTLKVSLDSRDTEEKELTKFTPTHLKQSLGSNYFGICKKVVNDNITTRSENIRNKQFECVSVQTSNMEERENSICYTEASDDQKPTTSAYRYEFVDMGYCNTYPKESKPNAPLMRSNTDNGKIECIVPSLTCAKKNIETRKKSLNEPIFKSEADTSKSPKIMPRSKPDSGKKDIDQYNVSNDTKNDYPKEGTSQKPLLTPRNKPDKKEFCDRHTSMSVKKEDSKYDKKKTFLKKLSSDRHTSIDKGNKSSNGKQLKTYLKRPNPNSDKEQFSGRPALMGKESDNSKEVSLERSNYKSKPNSDEEDFSDRHILLGKGNEKFNTLLPKSNIDSDKINTNPPNNRKDVETQYDYSVITQHKTKETATDVTDYTKNSNDTRDSGREKSKNSEKSQSSSSNANDSKCSTKDPLLDIIRDITKRYKKKEIDKGKRKKCYAEIISVLNYLLDTSETTENESSKARSSSASEELIRANRSPHRSKSSDKPKKTFQKDIIDYNICKQEYKFDDKAKKTFKDTSVQSSPRKSKQNQRCGEYVDCPISTDIHSTSIDTAACRTQHKHKHQYEKHQCCKSHYRKCDISSSSSVIDTCKHRCYCRGHKSHRSRTEKTNKCVAYNLILQTSDSIASEEIDKRTVERHLKNIVVKVPSKRRVENMQFKEVTKKIESDLPRDQFANNVYGARRLPQDNEVSSTDNIIGNAATCTIRDYLERNRPDFVERSTQRQSCLKLINEARASERATKREVLSAHVARDLADPSDADLRRLAEVMGKDLRSRKLAPKFISEKEMKKHSEKIYKSLPEAQRKKEEIKKERIKKTNLLMANIFKKNLQKKTLRGAVNLSNYSAIIKI